MAAMPNKMTIRDVAREAGVAVSTVSKVLNASQRFTPDVESRVREAAERLAFRPNPHARSMTTGVSKTIGVVILDIENPYYAAVVKGASREAATRGYTVLLADTEESPQLEAQLIEALALRVDGLLLAGSRLPDAAIVALGSRDKPVVAVGRVPGGVISSVTSDEYSSAFQLTRHLILTGRKRIAYLHGPKFWVDAQRHAGYGDALAEAGLKPLEWTLVSPNLEAGAALAGEVFLGARRVDAVLAYNDLAALGLLRAARELGVRVPEDIAVAGFGDIPFSAQASPPLTTAAAPSLEIGRRATALLIDRLAGGEGLSEPLVMPSRLIVRESTRASRQALEKTSPRATEPRVTEPRVTATVQKRRPE